MRLSILIGLLYVAYCINPLKFDELSASIVDLLLIGVTFWLALIADLKDLLYKQKTNQRSD